MQLTHIESAADKKEYAEWLNKNAPHNLWQSLEWATYSEAKGESVRLYALKTEQGIIASALCIVSKTVGGFSTWSLPRGPVWTDEQAANDLVEHIIADAKRSRCVQLYTSPNSKFQIPNSKFRASNRLVFPEASVVLDLTKTMDELKKEAKQKARYNLKVAVKHDVTVKESKDATAFAALHTRTAKRNKFTKPQTTFYQKFLDSLAGSFLLYAYVPDTKEPIAGFIGVLQGNTGLYYYGASDYRYHKLMAPYALQWHAIEHCKAQGATRYDLFGIAPKNTTKHPWEGITAFKTKFGGECTEYPPEQTIVLRPFVAAALKLKRKLLH